LRFYLGEPPETITIPAPVDETSIGAKVTDVGLTGALLVEFPEKVFINPAFYARKEEEAARRRLQDADSITDE